MRRFHQDRVELNLAPMLDVVLLLLCFFVLTARFGVEVESSSSIELELPASSSSGKLSPSALFIDLAPNGEVGFNGEIFLLGQPELIKALQSHSGRDEDFIIRADAKVSHHLVVKLMDIATTLGYARLRIATQATKSQQP